MHLTEVRISGFKTFVDYTKIKINQDMVCVVGPNGCGKSNVLDAIRWVLGESSNKLIRTNLSEDVIFNGATGRAKSNRASVELIFDNSDKKVTGQFASFNEISIKRELNRDEASKYFINNQKARRKDVVNLFMGTGLGANSYALVQQGLVAQMVESKPDELRGMIEEAAQISQYKQRRHETSLKIKNTLENLSRVTDLQSEIEKQCKHLKKQAKAAKQYQQLKQNIFETKIKSIAFEYQILTNQKNDLQSKVIELEAKNEKINKGMEKIQTQMIEFKEVIQDLNEQKKQYETNRYQRAQEISRLEEKINQIEYFLNTSKEQKNSLTEQINSLSFRIKDAKEQEVLALQKIENLGDLEKENQKLLETKQQEFEKLGNQRQALLIESAEIKSQKNNIESYLVSQKNSENQLRNSIENQTKQQSEIETEISQIQLAKLDEKIEQCKAEIEVAQNKLNQSKLNGESFVKNEFNLKNDLKEIQNLFNEKNKQLQQILAEISAKEKMIASLEGTNQTLSKKELKQHNIDFSLLADLTKINKNWQKLIQAIIPELGAITLNNEQDEKNAINWLVEKLKNNQKVELEWFSFKQSKNNPESNKKLGDLILLSDLIEEVENQIPDAFLIKLSKIFLANDINQALIYRSQLNQDQSIITKEGIWLTNSWLKVIDVDFKLKNSPILVREKALEQISLSKQIKKELEKLGLDERNNQNQLDDLEQKIIEVREQIQVEQTVFNQKQQNLIHFNQELAWQKARLDELTQRKIQLNESLSINHLELKKLLNEDKPQAREDFDLKIDEINQQITKLNGIFALQKQQLEKTRSENQDLRESLNKEKIELQYRQKNIENYEAEKIQQEQMLQKLLNRQASEDSDNQKKLNETLSLLIKSHQNEEEKIEQINKKIDVQTLEFSELENLKSQNTQYFYEIDKQKNAKTIEIEQINSSQNQLLSDLIRIEKNAQSQSENADDNSENPAFDKKFDKKITNLINEYQDLNEPINPVNLDEIKNQIDAYEHKLNKMGPINHNAIEDYENSQNKLNYLNEQSTDITEALEILKQAMKKIDNQTKAMFETTFNQLNQYFSEYFPVLFGGGSAKLVLTEDDLLTSGVIIDAKPLGKRNKHISMLSGGEKALTAIALILSFFSLNPAPFCMLDEVDAPLDDYNTQKFTDLIKQKSSEVQFICISHNKITMQAASQLLGVTMREAGVSKVVSVDIDKAMEFVA